MELAARETSPQRFDRVRLTEDVAKRHAKVIGAIVRRRKTVAIGLVLSASMTSCGGPPPPAPPAPTTSGSETSVALPPSPKEEAARVLAVAQVTANLVERCRMLDEATRLDPSSIEARSKRAESRCAPSAELVEDARVAFDLAHDVKTASTLAQIATRANRKGSALAACEVLVKGDATAKLLAARTYAFFAEHGRAAEAFTSGAADRAAAGATLDALDARLEAAAELARAEKTDAARGLLLAELGHAANAGKSYGAAWVGPKLVEAVAALRNAGDEKSAALVSERAHAMGVFVTAEGRRASEIERAIAAARHGNGNALEAIVPFAKTRALDRGARSALAVHARFSGKCAAASAHARAHEWLDAEGLRLDDDAAWARQCGAATGVPTSVVRPRPDLEIADAIAVAETDPSRARARVATIAKERPDDVAAAIAWLELALPPDRPAIAAQVVQRMPREPWLLATALPYLASRAQETKRLATEVVPATIEGVSRAAGEVLAAAVAADATVPELDELLLRACFAAPSQGPCVVAKLSPSLAKAAHALRPVRRASLAKLGPTLADADLRDTSLRLDVVLALVGEKKLAEARMLASPARGPFEGPESALARASIAAASGDCKSAKALFSSANVDASFADDLASTKKACP
jgi:hypothetical protein